MGLGGGADYGGNVGLHAGLPQIAANLHEAMTSPRRGRLAGVGLVNEALGYNAVVNDLLGEMAWRSEVPELTGWLDDFVAGRYGSRLAAARSAWRLLLETAYHSPGYTGTPICDRPTLQGQAYPSAITAMPPPYDNTRLAQAWHKLLDCADELGQVDTYRFDLVHLNRQVLGNLAFRLPRHHGRLPAEGSPALAAAAARFLELMGDLDELLATREELLLGRWLGDAEHWATNDAERQLYRWNARSIITLRALATRICTSTPPSNGSGMLTSFYLPRWQMFLERLDTALAEGKPLDAAANENAAPRLGGCLDAPQRPLSKRSHGRQRGRLRRLWEKYRTYFGRRSRDDGNAVPSSSGRGLG